TRPALARDLFTNASRDAAPLRKNGLRLDRQKSSPTANYQDRCGGIFISCGGHFPLGGGARMRPATYKNEISDRLR
ncbi:hypothetical protein, partial [Ensifer aridi]